MKDKLLIIGAGEHARVIVDAVEKEQKYKIAGLIDDNKPKGARIFNYEILGSEDALLDALNSGIRHCIIAIGDNSIRELRSENILKLGFSFASVRHPFSSIGNNVSVGGGTVILHGAVIDPNVSIGKGVIINANASVAHSTTLGNFSHISIGVNCGAECVIGDNSFIGIGVTIIPRIRIGRNVFIGAGSVVTKDVPDGVRVIGSPARTIIKTNKTIE